MNFNFPKVRVLWDWILDARYVCIPLIVIVVALFYAGTPPTTEKHLRLTGLLLQIIGIIAIIWEITETRAFFGHPSLIVKTKSWFGRFPLLKKKTQHVTQGELVGSSSSFMSAKTTVSKVSLTIEARVDDLEKNIIDINERITSNEIKMDDDFKKVNNSLESERQERIAEDDLIHKKLEDVGTGGLHLSAIGAFFLIVGVILSTAGIEIAEFLNG